jgi:hypothetical protein
MSEPSFAVVVRLDRTIQYCRALMFGVPFLTL